MADDDDVPNLTESSGDDDSDNEEDKGNKNLSVWLIFSRKCCIKSGIAIWIQW